MGEKGEAGVVPVDFVDAAFGDPKVVAALIVAVLVGATAGGGLVYWYQQNSYVSIVASKDKEIAALREFVEDLPEWMARIGEPLEDIDIALEQIPGRILVRPHWNRLNSLGTFDLSEKLGRLTFRTTGSNKTLLVLLLISRIDGNLTVRLEEPSTISVDEVGIHRTIEPGKLDISVDEVGIHGILLYQVEDGVHTVTLNGRGHWTGTLYVLEYSERIGQ